MLSIEDASAPALTLGGAKFNPRTLNPHGPHGPELYQVAMEVQDIRSKRSLPVSGIPEGARLEDFSWSPDGRKLAFTLRTSEVSDDAICRLWILDVATATAAPVQPEQRLNGVLGHPFAWLPDSQSMIVKRPIGTYADEPSRPVVPASPTVQQSVGGGAKAAVRTYPGLLTNEADEVSFRHYATVQLVHLQLAVEDSETSCRVEMERPVGPPAITTSFSPSPDGAHLLTSSIRSGHLSMMVPWQRFGRRTEVISLVRDAAAAPPSRLLDETPALEAMPIGHDAARPGYRAYKWRPDTPSTLLFVEALDGGDPKKAVDEAEHGSARDRLLLLEAPFDSPPTELVRTKGRFQRAMFGADGSALVWERWYHKRQTRISLVPPTGGGGGGGEGGANVYMEYDFSDAYGHPGTPLLERGPWGRAVLRKVGEDGMLWAGDGASAEGLRPFVDERGWSDCKRRRRLWRASVGCYEYPVKVLSKGAARRVAPEVEADVELLLISRRQTQEQPPQVLLRAASAPSAAAASDGAKSDDSRVLATLSDPPHPQPTLKGVGKSLIKYERADGVGLSGTLYTPAGYEPCRDGPLPTILWAYPREFKSKKSAGQVRGSEHTFTVVNWGSPLFWLTRGYAVLDGFAMPIIGEGEEHENDRYVEQLRMNAEAAVKELRRRGVSDHRLAVGGHSYGAFMTANLLAHTDLFCAGIARNGAYNRSLTPFGFQAEERPFWDAKATYAAMSPFNHADQISAPLLLIHSQADTNPGTFPMQSERMFAALKGLGACRARLCLLPNEAHWYRARETIMHVLAEQDEWLEAHVRHAKPPSPEAQDVTPKEKNEKPNQKE